MVPSPPLRLLTALLTLSALSLISACNGGAPAAVPVAVSAKLVKLADCGSLEQRLKAELTKRYERQGLCYIYRGVVPPQTATTGDTLATTAPSSAFGGGTSLSYSETNVQEKGVDEGDLVKTDGSFLYLARGSRFLVLKAQPPEESAIVSDIDLKEPISEIHLAGGRVTLITNRSNPVPMGLQFMGAVGMPYYPVKPVTSLYFYDVTLPAAPLLTARYDFPGHLQGSRRIDNTIYLVTNHSVDLASPATPWNYLAPGTFDPNAYAEANTKATTENLKRIEALTLADLLPTYSRTLYSDGVAGSPVVAGARASGEG
jgi:hypothetical protein